MAKVIKRGQTYGFQKAVPKDLRFIVGKSKIQHSLKTDSLKLATMQGHQLDAHYAAEFRRLRNLDTKAITTAQLQLADLGVILEEPVYTAKGSDEALTALANLAAKLLDRSEDDAIESRADFKQIGNRGLMEAIPDPTQRRAVVRQMQGHLDQLRESQLEDDLRPVQRAQEAVKGIAPQTSETPAQRTTVTAAEHVTDLIDVWVSAKSPTDKAEVDARMALKGLLEFAGKTDLTTVTKADVSGWLVALRNFPARRKHVEDTLPFKEVLRIYQGREYLTLSGKTVQKRFTLSQAVFTHAYKSGLIESNPFATISAPTVKSTVDRKPFTPAHLSKMFTTEPLDSGALDAFYWTPVLALSSGMRLGEICILTVDDMQRSESGIWYFDLTTKKLKTESSRRRVPIHKDLIAADFHLWASSQLGKTIMNFPPDVKGSPSGIASKRYARFLKKVVQLDEPGLVFHSFRHTFKDLCREAGIPSDVHARLSGHAGKSVGDSYGDFPITVLSEAVNKIKLPIKVRKALGNI